MITDDVRTAIVKLLADRVSVAKIAKAAGVPRRTVYHVAKHPIRRARAGLQAPKAGGGIAFEETDRYVCPGCGLAVHFSPCVVCSAQTTQSPRLPDPGGPDPFEWTRVSQILEEDQPPPWPDVAPDFDPSTWRPFDWLDSDDPEPAWSPDVMATLAGPGDGVPRVVVAFRVRVAAGPAAGLDANGERGSFGQAGKHFPGNIFGPPTRPTSPALTSGDRPSPDLADLQGAGAGQVSSPFPTIPAAGRQVQEASPALAMVDRAGVTKGGMEPC